MSVCPLSLSLSLSLSFSLSLSNIEPFRWTVRFKRDGAGELGVVVEGLLVDTSRRPILYIYIYIYMYILFIRIIIRSGGGGGAARGHEAGGRYNDLISISIVFTNITIQSVLFFFVWRGREQAAITA